MHRSLLTLVCLLSLATAASLAPGHDTPQQSARSRPATHANQPISDSLTFKASDEFHGVTRPAQHADLPALVRGVISVVHVQEGQSVRQGEPLITLDDRVPAARLKAATVKAHLNGTLQRAQVDLKMAESRLHRLQRVTIQGAGAAFELEEAQSTLERARAAVQQQQDLLKAAEAERQLAQAELDQYTIHAPFDGTVIELHRRSGTVDPSVPLVTIANLRTLEVEMHLPARMFGSVQPGESIALLARPPVAQSLQADVISVSPLINSASNTFRCLLRTDNSRTGYPAGFNVVLDSRDTSPTTAARTHLRIRR